LRKEPSHEEANRNYFLIESLKKKFQQARMFYSDKDYHNALHLLTELIEVKLISYRLYIFRNPHFVFFFQTCPWDISLREMRSECYLSVGEHTKAISDLKAATKLMSDNTDAFMKLSKLYYALGEPEDSLM